MRIRVLNSFLCVLLVLSALQVVTAKDAEVNATQTENPTPSNGSQQIKLNQILITQDDDLLRLLGYQSLLMNMYFDANGEPSEDQLKIIEDARELLNELLDQPVLDRRVNAALVFLCDSEYLYADCMKMNVLDKAMENDPGNLLYPLKMFVDLRYLKTMDDLDKVKLMINESTFYDEFYALGAAKIKKLLFGTDEFHFQMNEDELIKETGITGLSVADREKLLKKNNKELSKNIVLLEWLGFRAKPYSWELVHMACRKSTNSEACQHIGFLLSQNTVTSIEKRIDINGFRSDVAKVQQDYLAFTDASIAYTRARAARSCLTKDTERLTYSLLYPGFIGGYIDNVEVLGQFDGMIQMQASLAKFFDSEMPGSKIKTQDSCHIFFEMTDQEIVDKYLDIYIDRDAMNTYFNQDGFDYPSSVQE